MSLIQGADGSVYGSTSFTFEEGGGCISSLDSIFRIDASGSFTTLYSFADSDGSYPSSLIHGTDGSFYGTTYQGGAGRMWGNCGAGVIFRLDVGLGGLRLPGDCNADGTLDISDAVCLLGHLFLGAPEKLPCGSGQPDDPANVRLLDHNGDRELDLSDPMLILGFLFLGALPPHAGLECVPIGDCAAVCPR